MENEEQPIRQNAGPSLAVTIPLSIIAFVMVAYFFQSIMAGNCASRVGQKNVMSGEVIASRWSFTDGCMVLASGGISKDDPWKDEGFWDSDMGTYGSIDVE